MLLQLDLLSSPTVYRFSMIGPGLGPAGTLKGAEGMPDRDEGCEHPGNDKDGRHHDTHEQTQVTRPSTNDTKEFQV